MHIPKLSIQIYTINENEAQQVYFPGVEINISNLLVHRASVI